MKKYLILFPVGVVSLFSCHQDEIRLDFDYQAGDVITIVPTFDSSTDSVVYRWEDIIIGTEREPPFVHRFVVDKNVSSGTHTYYVQIFNRLPGANGTSSCTYSRTVTIK